MRKVLLTIVAAWAAFSAQAQGTVYVSSFDTLSLSKPDTFYVNYSSPGDDVGFLDAGAWFPCVYDTGFGFQFWSNGFAYSNMTDSVTSGIVNQYAAKPGSGYNSSQYAVAYGNVNTIRLTVSDPGVFVQGCYISNSTYAYNSMRDGDMFSKKFGGATGDDPDWFKVVVRGYSSGNLLPDSVEYYLADFRDTNNANDYIVSDWQWLDLQNLGVELDSLEFELSSSDTGQFGMNTPAYFCMDDFTITIPTSVAGPREAFDVRIYPNPATSTINISAESAAKRRIKVIELTGKIVKQVEAEGRLTAVDVAEIPSGTYLLQIEAGEKRAIVRFNKH